MQKSNIEWTDYAWNPIKGLCPVDCKLPDGRSYCYARKMYLNPRYGWSPEIRYDPNAASGIPKPGSKIFVCSTFELFNPRVKKPWRDEIFNIITRHPKHVFIILTKFPQNIDQVIPDNVWLGVSIAKNEDIWRKHQLIKMGAKVNFISFEPLLEELNITLWDGIDWIIVGKLSKFGKKYDPDRYSFMKIYNASLCHRIPIFFKNNLKNIYKGPLIQEYPK